MSGPSRSSPRRISGRPCCTGARSTGSMPRPEFQSWRADSFQPSLQRNLRVIRDNIAPNAYFIDVWSSIAPFDHWTDDGKLITSIDTERAWGEAFAWIRNFLGNDAPMISEAGHDNLI